MMPYLNVGLNITCTLVVFMLDSCLACLQGQPLRLRWLALQTGRRHMAVTHQAVCERRISCDSLNGKLACRRLSSFILSACCP